MLRKNCNTDVTPEIASAVLIGDFLASNTHRG
jgi:hypothetical protein